MRVIRLVRNAVRVEEGGERNLRTANPLRSRVNDDIRAVVNGPDEEAAGAKRVVDDDRDTGFVRDGDDLFKVRHVVLWVADALELRVLHISHQRSLANTYFQRQQRR